MSDTPPTTDLLDVLREIKADPMACHSIAVWGRIDAALAAGPPDAPPPQTMQEVVDQLDVTRAEASSMMRHGFEMVAMGARLYGAFLSEEIKR